MSVLTSNIPSEDLPRWKAAISRSHRGFQTIDPFTKENRSPWWIADALWTDVVVFAPLFGRPLRVLATLLPRGLDAATYKDATCT